MRIQSWSRRSPIFGVFTPFEVAVEVDEAKNDDRDAALLNKRMLDQPAHMPLEIFANLPALPPQLVFGLVQLIRPTPPRPIHIVVTDRDQDQIGKPICCEQLIDLSGKIARAQNTAKE